MQAVFPFQRNLFSELVQRYGEANRGVGGVRTRVSQNAQNTMPAAILGEPGAGGGVYSHSVPPGQYVLNPTDSHQLRITHAFPNLHK